MHPADIQASLKKRGLTQKAIATALKVDPTTVSRVIRGLEVSDRVMRKVAEAIGLPVHEVFPDYFLSPPKTKASKAFGPLKE